MYFRRVQFVPNCCYFPVWNNLRQQEGERPALKFLEKIAQNNSDGTWTLGQCKRSAVRRIKNQRFFLPLPWMSATPVHPRKTKTSPLLPRSHKNFKGRIKKISCAGIDSGGNVFFLGVLKVVRIAFVLKSRRRWGRAD